MTSENTFAIRGVIEGFYGYYYTFAERNDLIRFLGAHGFNYYIYAPKNDHQHRDAWRKAYPDRILEAFRQSVEIARAVGVEFCYALSPLAICYSSEVDLNLVKEKFKTFYDLGVRSFSLLMDDIAPEFHHPEDRLRFRSFAAAHAFLGNSIADWLTELDPANHLSMCPTDYHGTPPFSPYLAELGAKLKPEIDLFYTGPDVCSLEIKTTLVQEWARVAGRKPLIWDNYPVNDLTMQGELHIGPVTGRDPDLATVCKGLVANTMLQAEVSKIPLLTLASYFQDPHHYNPDVAWEQALAEVAGPTEYRALRVFAEHALKSCLAKEAAPKLKALTKRVLLSLLQGESPGASGAVAELEAYLDSIDRSCYHLLYYATNQALRQNLLPWIDLLKQHYWAGKRALQLLKVKEQGEDETKLRKLLLEAREKIARHPKQIAGRALPTLVEYILLEVGE